MHHDGLHAEEFRRKMTLAGEPELAVGIFLKYYQQLIQGADPAIPEASIVPVLTPDVLDITSLPDASGDVTDALRTTVIIKLSGGLGTSMGLEIPKAAVEAKDGYSFLDITARQTIQLNADHASRIPLVVMASFRTREAMARLLEPYAQALPVLTDGLFTQHKFPRVLAATMGPVDWPVNPALEWSPPGHGDLFAALVTSGLLTSLLDQGIRYAFISNVDNLGAHLDARILSYLATSGCPFLMEVADRLPGDRKGGHLAKRPDGRLILREVAQCPATDLPAFQDISRHRYFNTNNIWVDLLALKKLLAKHDNMLPLPLIKNEKSIDARDSESPRVYQLESAMGSAIGLFAGARAIRVDRDRFTPVKRVEDLFLLRSDRFILTGTSMIAPNPACATPYTTLDLDPSMVRDTDRLAVHFPFGPPSLVSCESLSIRGDVRFGKNIILKGRVAIRNPHETQMLIPDNSVIAGQEY